MSLLMEDMAEYEFNTLLDIQGSDYKDWSDEVLELRYLGWTRRQVADRLDISPDLIATIEELENYGEWFKVDKDAWTEKLYLKE